MSNQPPRRSKPRPRRNVAAGQPVTPGPPGGSAQASPSPSATPSASPSPAAGQEKKSPFKRAGTWIGSLVATAIIAPIIGIYVDTHRSDIADAWPSSPLKASVTLEDGPDSGGYWWTPSTLPEHLTLDKTVEAITPGRRTDVAETDFELTLEGAKSHTVSIVDVRAKILKRSPVQRTGTLVYISSQGADDNLRWGVDLDRPNTRLRGSLGASGLSAPYFDSHSLTLQSGEVKSIGIQVHAYSGDYLYVLVLSLVVDGKPQEFTVMNGSQPFHTTGVATRYDRVLSDTYSLPASPMVSTDPTRPCLIISCTPVRITSRPPNS